MNKIKQLSKAILSLIFLLFFFYYLLGSMIGLVITAYQLLKPPKESIHLVLDNEWKLISSHNDNDGKENKEYIRNKGKANQDEISEYSQPFNSSKQQRLQVMRYIYNKAQEKLTKLNCITKPISSLPILHKGPTATTAFLFSCPDNKETGMTYIFNDDSYHISIIVYRLQNSFPMTPAGENKILMQLKNIQVCRYRDINTFGDRFFHLLGWDYMAGNGYMCVK